MKRLFIGSFVDEDVLSDKMNNISEDFSGVLSGKWVEPHNLHFTFSFIGNVEDEIAELIKTELSSVLIKYKSSLEFEGLGAFPHINKPRVIYAKMYNPGGVIFKIKNEVDRELSRLHLELDETKFKPHITICRVKKVLESPEAVFNTYENTKFGEMQNFSVELVESILTNKGPIYKKL
jgi:2'-5' RNA ligase